MKKLGVIGCVLFLTGLFSCNKPEDPQPLNVTPQVKSVIESSNYFLYYHTKQNIEEIICFTLIKINKKVCDILLLCAIPNNKEFGSMMAYKVYEFAIFKKCNKIYTAPRTNLLRKTFIRYGFEHLRGVKDYDEVLVKNIQIPQYIKTSSTFRRKKLSNTKNIKLKQLIVII